VLTEIARVLTLLVIRVDLATDPVRRHSSQVMMMMIVIMMKMMIDFGSERDPDNEFNFFRCHSGLRNCARSHYLVLNYTG